MRYRSFVLASGFTAEGPPAMKYEAWCECTFPAGGMERRGVYTLSSSRCCCMYDSRNFTCMARISAARFVRVGRGGLLKEDDEEEDDEDEDEEEEDETSVCGTTEPVGWPSCCWCC